MNKRYASILALVTASGAVMAQHAGREVRMSGAFEERRGHVSPAAATDRSIIWQDDFSVPSNWTITNEPDAFPDVTWEIGIGIESGGQYGTPAIQSPTAANGYAMLCSDCGANQDGTQYEKSNLTTTNPIDLSAYAHVILEFQTQYRRFTNEQCYVSISTDGTTWPQPPSDTATIDLPNGLYPVWRDGELTTSVSPGNPTRKRINITSSAANQSTVWVRFYWYGIWGYAWYVDDVNIFEQFNDDRGLEYALVSQPGSGDEYGRVPLGQSGATINVGGTATNFGVNDQTNVVIHTEMRDDANNVVLTHESAPFDLATEESGSIDDPVSISGQWPVGAYHTTTWVTSDQDAVDEDNSNDTLHRVFEVTPDTYSLDGVGVYPSNQLTSLGSNSFTDNTDALYAMTNYVFNQDFEAEGIWVGLQTNGRTLPGALINVSVHDSVYVVPNADETTDAGDMSQPLTTSSDYEITEADTTAGFAYVPFTAPITLVPGTGYMAAVQMYSNNNATPIRILDDNTVPQTAWASAIYLPNGNPFGTFTNGNALLIRLVGATVSGIEEEKAVQNVHVFPNPTNGLVNLVFTKTGKYTVQLVNALGETVATKRMNGTSTMDLGGFAHGVYSLRITDGATTNVKRITLN